jgi:hypothetical protein
VPKKHRPKKPANAGETATITDIASFDSNTVANPAKKKRRRDNELCAKSLILLDLAASSRASGHF